MSNEPVSNSLLGKRPLDDNNSFTQNKRQAIAASGFYPRRAYTPKQQPYLESLSTRVTALEKLCAKFEEVLNSSEWSDDEDYMETESDDDSQSFIVVSDDE